VPATVRRRWPDGVDGVVDLISRDARSFTAMAGLATPTGRAVSTLGAAPAEAATGPRIANIHSEGDPALLQRVADLVVTGALGVPVVEVVPFRYIDEAFERLASGPRGKIGLSL
jgi:NADPH2:quinone reductase